MVLAAGRHPDLWAGVIAGNVLTDWIVEYEEGPDQALVSELFGGSVDQQRDAYIESSPITHVKNVQAPIMLLQALYAS